MKAPEADPTKNKGQYVAPKDWNDLVNNPDVTLIDTRNNYETAVGIFKGAIDPEIETFCLFGKPDLFAINSTLVRELAFLGESIEAYVLPSVAKIVTNALNKS